MENIQIGVKLLIYESKKLNTETVSNTEMKLKCHSLQVLFIFV